MSDGTSLRQSWYNALDDAQTAFRRNLTSSGSSEWKRVPVPSENTSTKAKGKARSSVPELADVVVHRKSSPNEDAVYRVVLDIPTGDEPVSLETWKSILSTPELRREWDPAVEGASLIEMFDPTTRIAKTKFTLGWPANPRDAVTISRMFNDATTVIDISTSLPRSTDEPAYLRPSPPYVRSDVKLFAWCIQHIQPAVNSLDSHSDEASLRTVTPGPPRLRITCFWQHDLRALWNFASTSSMAQQLASMVLGLFKAAIKRRCRVPVLTGYGNGVTIERSRFDIDRESLAIDYAIIPEDDDRSMHILDSGTALEDLHARREHRRLARSVEFSIPVSEGWDIQLSTSASSDQVAQLPWTARAYRNDSSAPSTSTAIDYSDRENVTFLVSHTSLLDDHSVLKVRIVIERSGPSSGLRLNGIPQRIEVLETRDPSYFMSEQMLQDATSTADLSFHTVSSTNTAATTLSVSSGSKTPLRPQLNRTFTARSSPQEKSILSRVRRNYIYFSSLLQEPEAKWKRTTEARGVSITQLDSIDPTLVVYRAEATFVGVGLWDLYAAITSPGARAYWDKQHEDAILLEDVNELTELWHFKAKPAWPTNARDSVVLKTVYKSPTTVHVFAFSADDPNLFPNIPPPDLNTIRTQVDLQGFAIESLSPTTTLLTLLEQSDPKGWSNKASIPQQMITVLAGVGEFAIRCGGPPVATRLAGAKANEMRYDHERGVFRIEYEVSASRRATSSALSTASPAELDASSSTSNPIVECELRCDIDTWAYSLDIVVDPPPQSISCFRRHRLSSGGGGLWLTLTHDAVLAGEERLMAIVRKGPGRERGVVMVNGSKIIVDVEELPEAEIKSLSKQKRIKPTRIPLDQPPVMGVIRRRKMEWSEGDGPSETASNAPSSPTSSDGKSGSSVSGISTTSSWTGTMPKFPSPLSRYFTFAIEQAASTTQQAVAAISPMSADDSAFSATKPPMQYALEALSYARDMYFRPSLEGWTPVATKGLSIYRTLAPQFSPSVPTYKGEKVIEGISAEEIAAVVTNYESRKNWDERFDSAHVLESFGAESHTAFVVSKSGFPFRDRGFYLASVVARVQEQDAGDRTAVFIVAASFNPDSVARFAPGKYNPYTLPIGRMFVDAWVLETLDPYTPENYAIPSTRCTRFVAADYAGSIPAAVNAMTNSTLVKSVLAVEAYVKSISSAPFTRLPTAGLVLNDKRAEGEAAPASWALKRKDETRLLVRTRYTPEDRVYKSTLLLSLPPTTTPPLQVAPPEPTSRTASPETSSSDEAQPQARPHSRSVSSVPASLVPRRRRLSSTQQTMRSASRDAALRASSSAFTIRGEVRQHTDFLVAEFVVDSKLYPDGYAVTLSSRIHDGNQPVSLEDKVEGESETVLPLTWTVHTLPSSPMHSSGLTADRPPRHLVRLMLPTAQQQISTLLDPLTGETRQPPPKPQWLVDLQNAGAAIEVEIGPAEQELAGGVSVNGKAVRVEGEKESLTSLGREELQDDRVGKMMVLTRSSSDEGELPRPLRIPVGEADQLLDPASMVSGKVAIEEPKESEDMNAGTDGGQDHAGAQPTPPDNLPATPGAAVPSSGGGFLGFLQSYPNPLLRFKSGSAANTRATSPATSSGSSQASASPRGFPGALPGVVSVQTGTVSYPLSTVIVIAVIAFLIGSLLRSLISPADFIYVVTDTGEAEEVQNGWREIRRLVELKYIVGGWDFQIAVVRRH
ncbi:hypothetical protein OF83DRAFT_1101647 [Amylostereum chailletii]|nr:hypothetical protein OF83DRAFT_1101647 [Amylostereum chailletii]